MYSRRSRRFRATPDEPPSCATIQLGGTDDVVWAWDPSLGYGWVQRGTRSTFRSREPVSGAVSRMIIAQIPGDPIGYSVRIATPRTLLVPNAPNMPLSLVLIIDGLGPSTSCGQARFGAPRDPAPPAAR
jgi:hypothetical protein